MKNDTIKPKAIYFFQYLPPWRIDVFNEMAKHYDLTVVFFNANTEGFTYDREGLLARLVNVKTIFLKTGFNIGARPIRFGIGKILSQIKPEVVFVHEYSFVSIFLTIWRMLHVFKFKLFITTSDHVDMAKSSRGFKKKSRDFVIRHCDGAILYSKAVKEWYEHQYPELKNTGVCPNIQNPQSLLAFKNSFDKHVEEYLTKFNLRDKKILLYTGRLNPVKGLDLLLNAFADSDYKDYVMVLVGNGDEENSLKEQAKRLGIENNVVFAGFYSGEALYSWYSIANFFILPSRYEPFGAVINECLVYGCPAVASKYIGALDFINSENGLVFDPLNHNEFVETLNKAYTLFANTDHRVSLMFYSFDDSVKSFINIVS